MPNSLTVYGNTPNALELIKGMGKSIATSQLLGCQSPEQGEVMAMTCIAKGVDPLSLAQRYDIIQGKLSMKSDAMLAEFRARGGKQKVIERTADAAEVELSIDGETFRSRLTWEEAQQESFTKGKDGKVKDNYARPRMRMQMLWARAVSDGVRVMAPEVNTGVYTPEEISDFGETDDLPSPLVNESDSNVEDAEYVKKDDGLATGQQISRITELFAALDVPAAKQLTACKKRGAESMASLNQVGADNLIASLESMLAKKNEATAGESKADPEATSASVSGPASEPLVAEIKGLLKQISQTPGNADVGNRVKAKLGEHGLQKIADLSEVLARQMRDHLAVRNIDAFFEMQLSGEAGKG